MISSPRNPKLVRLYDFFETYGTERLDGLDESYFQDLNESEKQEAWDFLEDRFWLSSDNIKGLYILNKDKAIYLFKKVLSTPIESTPHLAQRRHFESNRLLMLKYVYLTNPIEIYGKEICEFAKSEFAEIRSQFANSVPVRQVMPYAVEALKAMVFTETELLPRGSATLKLMEIYGLKFQMKNMTFRSIHQDLCSDNSERKIKGLNRLTATQSPDYAEWKS